MHQQPEPEQQRRTDPPHLRTTDRLWLLVGLHSYPGACPVGAKTKEMGSAAASSVFHCQSDVMIRCYKPTLCAVLLTHPQCLNLRISRNASLDQARISDDSATKDLRLHQRACIRGVCMACTINYIQGSTGENSRLTYGKQAYGKTSLSRSPLRSLHVCSGHG